MDLNSLMIWIAGPSCLMVLVAALRASPRLKGWIFVALAILAIGGIAYLIRPEIAGRIAGSLWVVFVLGPSLAQTSSRRWALRQKYDRAVPPAKLAGILHPFDGIPQLSKFLQAMSLADKGQIESALAILRNLETTAPVAIARPAAVHARRLSDDWGGLVAWVESNIDPNRLFRDYNVLPMYVRALGEMGQLGKMLQVAARSKLSRHPQLASFRNMCRLFVFAFCGQPAPVADTFNGPLSLLPHDTQRFWIATANYAAGLTAAAQEDLTALQSTAGAGLQISIRLRRAHPPVQANSMLTDADVNLLHQLETESEHELRFAAWTPGHGQRPWVTYALILGNIAMFAAEWALGAGAGNWLIGGSSSDEVLHRLGAMEPDVLQTHEYYRLVSANFLHYGYLHILMNMLGLCILGPFVEFNLGRIQYLLLYLISGVAVMATVLCFQLHHWIDPDMLVGASGAIMAIIGATAAILLRGWYRERAVAASRRLILLGFIILMQVTFDHFTPQVSGMAHIAGIAWGFVLASILPHRKRALPPRGFSVIETAKAV